MQHRLMGAVIILIAKSGKRVQYCKYIIDASAGAMYEVSAASKHRSSLRGDRYPHEALSHPRAR